MTTLQQLINGVGTHLFWWELVELGGNDKAETIHTAKTYEQALTQFVNAPNKENIIIELWHSHHGNIHYNNFVELNDKVNTILKT